MPNIDMEFLHTRDPLFFNKPPTQDLYLRFRNERLKLTYRVIQSAKSPKNNKDKEEVLAPYEDNETDMVSCVELDDGIEIVSTEHGNYVHIFHIAERCYSHIIGAKGHKRREIENSTNTNISIPKPEAADEDIVITGRSERAVLSARNRINMILLQLRERERPTHFVSIPVGSSEIQSKFLEFKKSVLYGTAALRGVEESIFQKPEKLHLTITTLVLWDDSEIQQCIRIINEKKYELWPLLFPSNEPLKMVMEGLEIMNDDPKDVHVLYSKVHLNPSKYNNGFQRLVNALSEALTKAAFVNQRFQDVKLHVTLMNSSFRNPETAESDKVKRKSFDASLILEKYRDFKFGTVDLKALHLSIRFQFGDDKYYKPEYIIEL